MPDNLLIAILTDEWTASSGEAVLLAFRGMENVRTFGAPTAGYASLKTIYTLYDGAQLWLTVAADVSVRTGEVFCDDPVPPDVMTMTLKKKPLRGLKLSAITICHGKMLLAFPLRMC